MKKRGVLLVMISVLFVLLGVQVEATVTCSIKSSCSGGETDFGGLSALNNSHYEIYNESNYNNRICCSAAGTTLTNSCSGNYAIFIRTVNETNAHVEQNNESTVEYFDVCMGVGQGALSITYQEDSGACTGQNTCIMTIQGSTNAHVGDCGTESNYTRSVCASYTAPVPEFSTYALILAVTLTLVGGFFIRKKSL